MTVLASGPFMCPALALALALGFGIGGIYTLSTALPFLLIDRAGLSEIGFGLAMMLQTGTFMLVSILARQLLPRLGIMRVTQAGLLAIAAGGIAFPLLPHVFGPSVASYMLGVAIWVAGNALAMPGLTSQALDSRQSGFGAAASVLGFVQIGVGFAGSTLLSWCFGDVGTGTAVLLPAMAAGAFLCGGYGIFAAQRRV